MNSYIYEVQFYLSIILYDKYLKNENILLDRYKKSIRYIYNDYIELKKDFILELLNECIEY